MANALVRVFTAARMLAIEAQAVVGAAVVGDNLTLFRNNGGQIGPFNVRGPKGDTGNVNALTAWPIGSVYISVDIVNPASKLGGGTWAVFASGKTLVGVSTGETEFNTVEKTGGAKTVTLTANQSGLRAHNHAVSDPGHRHGYAVGYSEGIFGPNWTFTSEGSYGARNFNVGGDNLSALATTGLTVQNCAAQAAIDAHNNLSPYITVYMWKRTA